MAATPKAQELAVELGVDLDSIEGTGKGGKVTVADVRASTPEAPLTVVGAVESDLAQIGQRDRALARSGLAASALSLARSLDDPNTSATARSNCARALLDTLDRLRELAPPAEQKDELDDLIARRANRLARRAAT